MTINATKWAAYAALVQTLTMWAYHHRDAAWEFGRRLAEWYATYGGSL